MSSFVNYLIEANLGTCFFLLIYQILLSKETDHQFNRIYLLMALSVSLALPLLHLQIPSFFTFEKALATYWLPEVRITPSSGDAPIPATSFWFWVALLYALGAIIFFFIFLTRLMRVIVAVYQSPRIKNGSVWLIELKNEQEVFSFFNFIFIGKRFQLTETEKQQIVRHEQVHISNYHSFDILFVNLINILFWFNPFLKTYRRLFIQLHEFEADARSVDSDEVDSYCCLLARATLASSGYQLANHFTNSLTLKRIQMMKTLKNKINNQTIVLVVVAAFGFCYFIVGNDFVFAQTKTDPDSDKIYSFAENGPTFGKGADFGELSQFIAANLRYPEEARKKGIEGKVFAKFVVEKDGSVSNVEIVKGVGYGLDEETLRVMKSLPKWNPATDKGKPVRISFTMPIAFKLSEPRKGG